MHEFGSEPASGGLRKGSNNGRRSYKRQIGSDTAHVNFFKKVST